MTPEFRIWDPDNDNYLEIGDSLCSLLLNPAWDLFDPYSLDFEQYTGLKDVDGNKIFEGDIVISSWDEMQEGGPGLYIEAKGQVAFDEGCFGVYNNEQGFRPLFTMTLNELHVVGNIHKNPELLEADE